MSKSKVISLVYGREYQDSDERYDEFFYIYNTVFRNVPMKHLKTLNTFKEKIRKYCDDNFTETASNFCGNTTVKIIHGDDYYSTYEDVFGKETVGSDNSLFNDYGQLWNGRQFFKKDYNPKLTEKYTYKNLNIEAS